jgi:type IV secretion system protein VirB1
MHHVVQVESSANPYAIGVVGGRLVRQPQSLAEAISTAEMLESRGYNFSVGLSQVNRYNLQKYGISTYAQAFDGCTNLQAGSKILSECQVRAKGDWGSAFSCYYSGNFTTGFDHGYVQKIYSSMASQHAAASPRTGAIPLATRPARTTESAGAGESSQERSRSQPDRGGSLVASTARPKPSRVQQQDTVTSESGPAVHAVVLNTSLGGAGLTQAAGANQESPASQLEGEGAASGDNAFVF